MYSLSVQRYNKYLNTQKKSQKISKKTVFIDC